MEVLNLIIQIHRGVIEDVHILRADPHDLQITRVHEDDLSITGTVELET